MRPALLHRYYYSSSRGGYSAFWILGDSLSRGFSDGALVGPTPLDDTVYEWHEGDTLIEITNGDLIDALDGSPWPQMGIDFNANTNRKIIFINSAVGGSTITDKEASGKIWTETGVGSIWQDALDELDGVTAVPTGAQIAGVIISGGVNDYRETVKPTAAEFKTAYQSLIDRVVARVGSVPIYLFQIAAVGTAEATLFFDMRKVMFELVEENSNVHLAFNSLGFAAQGYKATDTVHFIQDGNNIAGKQIARYIKNSNQSKRIREMLSLFDTELTTAEEDLWITFFQSCISNGNINALDSLQVYVASTEKNTQNDVMQVSIRGIDAPTFTQYTHLATDGSTTYVRTGHRPTTGRYSSQEDVIVGVKTGTFSTAAGTTAYLFGAFTTSGIMLFQNTSGLNYRVNDSTSGFWNGETQFASNTVYALGRNGGTRFLMKDKTEVHSAAVASSTPTGRDIAIGCRANGSSSFDNFSQTEVEYFFSAKWSTLDYDALIDDLNALTAGLKALA